MMDLNFFMGRGETASGFLLMGFFPPVMEAII